MVSKSIFILLSLLFSLQGYSQGQTRTKKVTNKLFYKNGNIKSVAVTRTTLPKYMDPMNFYRKISVKVTEYDSLDRHKTREYSRTTKIGNDGTPCYEIYFEEIVYDTFGHRISYTMTKCDKRKSVFKEYSQGKLVFTRISKRRRR